MGVRKMKLRTLISVSLIFVFLTGLVVSPVFASRKYEPVVSTEVIVVDSYPDRFIIAEPYEPTLVERVFDAAHWAIFGSLNMAGATYDATEDVSRDVLNSAGNTVDNTMQFTDDTINSATGTVLGSGK
jgi:hypothetical protein